MFQRDQHNFALYSIKFDIRGSYKNSALLIHLSMVGFVCGVNKIVTLFLILGPLVCCHTVIWVKGLLAAQIMKAGAHQLARLTSLSIKSVSTQSLWEMNLLLEVLVVSLLSTVSCASCHQSCLLCTSCFSCCPFSFFLVHGLTDSNCPP